MTAYQPLAIESGARLPVRAEWEAEADDVTPARAPFKVGDRVVPVGSYRPTTLVHEGGGVVAHTSFIDHHPIRVEDRSGQGYLFRPDELAPAGDWETAR